MKKQITFNQLKRLVKEASQEPEIEKIIAQLKHESILSDFDEDGEIDPPVVRLKGKNVITVATTFNDACVDEPGTTAWDNVANSARRAATRLWEYQQKYGKLGIQFVLLCDAQGPGGYFDFSDLKMSKVTSKGYIDAWVYHNAPEDDEGVDECKLNEGSKVTLTLGQLKKLVKEGTDPNYPYAAKDHFDKTFAVAQLFKVNDLADKYDRVYLLKVNDYVTAFGANSPEDLKLVSAKSGFMDSETHSEIFDKVWALNVNGVIDSDSVDVGAPWAEDWAWFRVK